jgi:putative chitinase
MNALITEERFRAFAPKCANVKDYVSSLNQLLPTFGIASKTAVQAFLAQYAHETGGYTKLVENTNYTTPERLMKVFPRHFPSLMLAKMYAGKPVNIASRVYAHRFGNGDEKSGDGYRYRGRGLCHLTFKDNYKTFHKATGIDVVQHPEFLEEVYYAVYAGCWYWKQRGLTAKAEAGDYEGVTKGINGGMNGHDDRLAWLKKAKEIFT